MKHRFDKLQKKSVKRRRKKIVNKDEKRKEVR